MKELFNPNIEDIGNIYHSKLSCALDLLGDIVPRDVQIRSSESKQSLLFRLVGRNVALSDVDLDYFLTKTSDYDVVMVSLVITLDPEIVSGVYIERILSVVAEYLESSSVSSYTTFTEEGVPYSVSRIGNSILLKVGIFMWNGFDYVTADSYVSSTFSSLPIDNRVIKGMALRSSVNAKRPSTIDFTRDGTVYIENSSYPYSLTYDSDSSPMYSDYQILIRDGSLYLDVIDTILLSNELYCGLSSIDLFGDEVDIEVSNDVYKYRYPDSKIFGHSSIYNLIPKSIKKYTHGTVISWKIRNSDALPEYELVSGQPLFANNICFYDDQGNIVDTDIYFKIQGEQGVFSYALIKGYIDVFSIDDKQYVSCLNLNSSLTGMCPYKHFRLFEITSLYVSSTDYIVNLSLITDRDFSSLVNSNLLVQTYAAGSIFTDDRRLLVVKYILSSDSSWSSLAGSSLSNVQILTISFSKNAGISLDGIHNQSFGSTLWKPTVKEIADLHSLSIKHTVSGDVCISSVKKDGSHLVPSYVCSSEVHPSDLRRYTSYSIGSSNMYPYMYDPYSSRHISNSVHIYGGIYEVNHGSLYRLI